MHGIWAIARQELRLALADRGALLWMFLMPIVFATVFGLVLRPSTHGDGKVRLALLDEDQGPVALALRAELADDRLILTPITAAERTAASRTLIIPAGFSARLLAGEQVTLRLEKDPDGNAQAVLVAQARILGAISRVIARLAQAASHSPDASVSAEEFAQTPPLPELITVEKRYAGQARIVPGGFAQAVPGNAVMFVMMMGLTAGTATITADRVGGRLRRLATTPLRRSAIIAGKILGRFSIAAAQVTLLILAAALGNQVFDLGLGDRWGSVYVLLLVYALAIAPLGILIGARFTDPDRAAQVGVLASLIMAALGGCWWPLEIVPKFLQQVALLFPTGWAMSGLHEHISFGRSLLAAPLPALVLLAFAGVAAALAARVLRFE